MVMGTTDRRALFKPGVIVISPGALSALRQTDVLDALVRHFRGDWGEVNEHDWKRNEAALKDGGRICSAYSSHDQTEFWIISEADRSMTTVLLPEY